MHIRRAIGDAIDEQLAHQPSVATRNRKPLPGLVAPFEHVSPIWELRVGDDRVFYDVDEGDELVVVRAIRWKAAGQTTEEIL